MGHRSRSRGPMGGWNRSRGSTMLHGTSAERDQWSTSPNSMWPTLERTRRRILRGLPPRGQAAHAASGVATDAAPTTELVVALGRPELDRLVLALQAMLGPETTRPDTPARLEAALAAAIEQLGSPGRPKVERRPHALYTPEAWQLHLIDVDPAVVEAIRRASRDGVFGT
jgi:hypothetical protein